jgi:hypothetical protein
VPELDAGQFLAQGRRDRSGAAVAITHSMPAPLTVPTGVITAAVPQAKTSVIWPDPQPARHCSIEIRPHMTWPRCPVHRPPRADAPRYRLSSSAWMAARKALHSSGLKASAIRISVWDCDARMPKPQDLDPDAESGRGLLLVDALCDDWGSYPVRPRGKVVWALVEVVR